MKRYRIDGYINGAETEDWKDNLDDAIDIFNTLVRMMMRMEKKVNASAYIIQMTDKDNGKRIREFVFNIY